MPLSGDQLRQLLTERSEPASYRPAPLDRIRVRIRRVRARRTVAAGLAATVAVAGVLSVAAVRHQPSSDHASAGGQQFPASFTAPDGASYWRVAVTSMMPAQKSAMIKLTIGPNPVDVMAACDGSPDPATVGVAVDGAQGGLLSCPGTPQLIGLPVRLDHAAGIIFTRITLPGIRDSGASWRFAVYEWKPPATARAAPPAPELPPSYSGNNTTTGHGKALLRKIASRSGNWPNDTAGTFTVLLRGRNLNISAACSGVIAGRLTVTMQIDGREASQLPCVPWASRKLPCVPWASRKQPPGNFSVSGPPGKLMTLTFRIAAPDPATAAAYAKRAASWTIAVYEEEF